MNFLNLVFRDEVYLFLSLFILFFIFIEIFLYKKQQLNSTIEFVPKKGFVFKISKYLNLIFISLIILFFSILISSPSLTQTSKEVSKNGIDIVFALDVSYSMTASDLKPTRLDAAKKVLSDFFSKLKSDRAGLVVFTGKPFVSIPLTYDYEILKSNIENISTSTIKNLDGTAIGDAILMSKNMFKKPSGMTDEEYKKREKVIVLLTDGDANTGVDPLLAVKGGLSDNVKIYTIGIGSKNGTTITLNVGGFPQTIPIKALNTETLKEISNLTNGKFYSAQNNDMLDSIFKDLSSLQKTDIKSKEITSYSEYNAIFLVILLLLIFVYGYLNFINIKTNNYAMAIRK